jgi:hypothetical protein
LSTTQEYLRGKSHKIAVSGSTKGITDSQGAVVTNSDPCAVDPCAKGSIETAIPIQGPLVVEENTDPLRPRIAKSGKRRGLWSLLARVITKPELTAEENAAMEENKARRLMEAQLRKEAELFKERIINALNRMGLCYRYPKSKNDFLSKGIQSAIFAEARMQPDAFYFKLDCLHLPQNTNIKQFMDQDIVDDLSIACQHRVSGQYSESNGAWYIVERASGSFGIPSHVMWQTMMDLFPESADGLSLPLGVTSNGRRIYKSLNQMYSMLIGGTIGSGKSNVLNSFICSLIRRNPPERLKLLMVDLKGGLEFGPYEGIPHLLQVPITKIKKKKDKYGIINEEEETQILNGIAYDRDQVPDLLNWLLHEGERRIGILKAAEVRDIGRYNQHHRSHALPHLVFIVDEIADLKINAETWALCMDRLTNIAQRFRAVGVHVILCTQMPKSDVIPTSIKAVLPAKLAFSCPTNQGSMAILDTGNAKGLTPAGRCILSWQDEMQIQTPLINDSAIQEIVAGAKAGIFVKSETKAHDVTQLEIQGWALEFDSGYLSRDRLYKQFQKRGITQKEINSWCEEWEGHEFVIGSSLYKVDKAMGNRARRLIAINETDIKEPIETTA